MRSLRPLLCSALLLVSGSAFAQAGRLSISGWGSFVAMDGTTTVDPANDVKIVFANGWGAGAGLAYGFSDLIDAELSVSHLESGGELDVLGSKAIDLGKLRMTPVELLLRLHPLAGGTIDPWIGVGGAYVLFAALSSDDLTVAGIGKVEVKDKAALLLDAGIGFRILPRLSLFLDGRYLPLKPTSHGISGADQTLKLNPLAISGGVRIGL